LTPDFKPDGTPRGNSRRYAVVLALFVLLMITYLDRVCISTAKEPLAA
jgi:hypothetical protein